MINAENNVHRLSNGEWKHISNRYFSKDANYNNKRFSLIREY